MAINQDQTRSLAERAAKANISNTNSVRCWPSTWDSVFRDIVDSGFVGVYVATENIAHESFTHQQQILAIARRQARAKSTGEVE